MPGPIQAAAVAALSDDEHVEQQRERYHQRLDLFRQILTKIVPAPRLPAGGFYLWVEAPDGDAWSFAEHLAAEGGVLVAPGDTFGPRGASHVRIAMVQPIERLELVGQRLGAR